MSVVRYFKFEIPLDIQMSLLKHKSTFENTGLSGAINLGVFSGQMINKVMNKKRGNLWGFP